MSLLCTIVATCQIYISQSCVEKTRALHLPSSIFARPSPATATSKLRCAFRQSTALVLSRRCAQELAHSSNASLGRSAAVSRAERDQPQQLRNECRVE